MKLLVAHKGLIIVTIPLVIELSVIAALSIFLAATDREYQLESVRRNLSMTGAKLTFGNWHAGVDLIKAWKQQDQEAFQSYKRQFKELENLTRHLEQLPQDDNRSAQELHLQVVKMEQQVLSYFSEIAGITEEGFSTETFRKVIQIQRKMYKHVDATFSMMTRLFETTDAQLRAGQEYLSKIKQLEIIVVEIGLALTFFAAVLLRRYYAGEFTARINTIRSNIERLGDRKEPDQDVRGDDEITQLNQAFHDLWRKLAIIEERESALFNNSADVILELDEKAIVTRANAAVSRMFGCRPQDLLGVEITTKVEPATATQFKQALLSTESGAGAITVEATIRSGDAGVLETAWSIFWSTQHRRWYCMVQDVSHLKNLERTRRLFLQQIAAGFQRPLHRLADIFNETLTGREELPSMVRDRLSGTPRSLARLTELVDGLLQLEELKNEMPWLNKAELSLKTLIEDAVRDVEPQARARRIAIQADCQSEKTCHADASSLVRVLINLLSNAVKFSPEETCVRISAGVDDQDNVVIQVQDQGRGIPAAAVHSLFQPFAQVRKSDAKRGQGTGLGLFICKQLIEAHNGRISVKSEEGKGTEFLVSFPRTADSDRPADTPAAALEPASPAPTNDHVQEKPRLVAGCGMPGLGNSLTMPQKGLILIAIPVALELIFVAFMSASLLESEKALVGRVRERHIATSAISMTTRLFDFAVRVRHIRSKDFSADAVRQIQIEFPSRLQEFMQIARQDPEVAKSSQSIKSSCLEIEPVLAQVNELLSKQTADSDWREYSNSVFYKSDLISRQVETLLAIFDNRELVAPFNLNDLRHQQITLLQIGLLLNICLTSALALFFSIDISRRLKVSAQNAQRLPAGLPLLEPVAGSDEIAALDRAFHQAAQRLSAARAKESAFLVNAQNILGALDENLRFITLSPSASRILGLPVEELIGKPITDLVFEEDAATVKAALEERPDRVLELETHTETTVSKYVSWSISWSPIERAFFAVGRDVTAQKQLERLKREFMAVITHDLRTPLTSILGNTLIALENAFGVLPAQARVNLKQVRREIDCMLELVNDLLDLEKLKSGKMIMTLEPVKLSEILQEARKRFHERLIDSDCEITIAAGDMFLQADKDRLCQCVVNLMLELQMLDPQEIDLRAEENEKQLTLSMAHRQKMSPEAAAVNKVLERFRNSDAGVDQSGPLRLPLALQILDGHGGKLTVACEDGIKLLLAFKKVPGIGIEESSKELS